MSVEECTRKYLDQGEFRIFRLSFPVRESKQDPLLARCYEWSMPRPYFIRSPVISAFNLRNRWFALRD